MITVVSSTNRRKSEAFHFARHYADTVRAHYSGEVKLLDLRQIPVDWFHPDMYEKEEVSESLIQLQEEYFLPAEKYVYVLPEYNGSFPGALKLLLDAFSVREYKKTFKGKKAILVGIATGRAGNLRGMDHLTGILHHLGTVVHPNKLPISSIEKLLNSEGEITDAGTLKVIENQVRDLLEF